MTTHLRKRAAKMAIALDGLALSHPFTFAGILRNRGIGQIHAWDPDAGRREAFRAQFPDASVHDQPESLYAARPDGVMICSESHLHAERAQPWLEMGVPVFIDKVMAVSRPALSRLRAAVASSGTPVFSSSILRFSPLLQVLCAKLATLDRAAILAAEATVLHSIEAYLKPGNTWQDDPDEGGGTLINMGVHGAELLAAALGAGAVRVFAHTQRRWFQASRSEDIAWMHLQYADGLSATVEVVGASPDHGYGLTVRTRSGNLSLRLPDPASDLPPLVQYGYEGLVEAFLQMVDTGQVPVPFADTEAIIKTLCAARDSARCGQWVNVV